MGILKDNTIFGKSVIQNKQDFVVSIYPIQNILKFTKYTNRLIVGYDEKGEPIYNNQIQRFVENSRVKKIADFLINDPDATFPTNLVLHIPKEVIEKQVDKDNNIEIHLDNKVFKELRKEDGDVFITIIDGQHRIRGIELAIIELKGKIDSLMKTIRGGRSKELDEKLTYFKTRLEDLEKIELIVTFFIDKTLEYQAMVFSTINRTQKKVSADLVTSLFGLNTGDTPQKTALQIVLSLNGHPKSPFYKRIKLYGGEYTKIYSPPLSQASMVKSIVQLISENLRESEVDRYKDRKDLNNRNSSSNRSLPFRKYYANDKDSMISDIFFFYFTAIKDLFVDATGHSYWDMNGIVKPNNILHTTVGYDSLMKILLLILEENKQINEETDLYALFQNYLEKSTHLNFSDVNRYSFTSRGKRYIYLDMSIAIFPSNDSNDKRIIELKTLESD